MNRHKNARTTPYGRALMVRRVRELGWSAARAAEAAGVSVRTVRKWLARHRCEGAAGLLDRSSRPRRSPPRMAALAEAEKARAGLARTLEAATHAAAQSRADLTGLLKELDAKDQELAAAKSAREEGERYTVRSGETLWEIALHHGVGLSALAQANDIGKPYRIYAGQKLRIPDGEAASAATGALRPHPPA